MLTSCHVLLLPLLLLLMLMSCHVLLLLLLLLLSVLGTQRTSLTVSSLKSCERPATGWFRNRMTHMHHCQTSQRSSTARAWQGLSYGMRIFSRSWTHWCMMAGWRPLRAGRKGSLTGTDQLYCSYQQPLLLPAYLVVCVQCFINAWMVGKSRHRRVYITRHGLISKVLEWRVLLFCHLAPGLETLFLMLRSCKSGCLVNHGGGCPLARKEGDGGSD